MLVAFGISSTNNLSIRCTRSFLLPLPQQTIDVSTTRYTPTNQAPSHRHSTARVSPTQPSSRQQCCLVSPTNQPPHASFIHATTNKSAAWPQWLRLTGLCGASWQMQQFPCIRLLSVAMQETGMPWRLCVCVCVVWRTPGAAGGQPNSPHTHIVYAQKQCYASPDWVRQAGVSTPNAQTRATPVNTQR